MNGKSFSGCPGTMAELVEIEEARRTSGFRNGYGQYVAAGMPGMEDGETPGDKPGNPPEGRTKCLICGNLFFPASKKQRYCCQDCREKGQLANKKKRYNQGKDPAGTETAAGACARCGKPVFLLGVRGKPLKYCSDACRNAARTEKARAAFVQREPEPVRCPICGKLFFSCHGGNVKYCGPACAREGARQLEKEWRNKKKEEGQNGRAGV